MSAYDTLIARELRQLLVDRVESLTAALASGHVQTIEDYRSKTGQIRALRDALADLELAKKRVLGIPDEK